MEASLASCYLHVLKAPGNLKNWKSGNIQDRCKPSHESKKYKSNMYFKMFSLHFSKMFFLQFSVHIIWYGLGGVTCACFKIILNHKLILAFFWTMILIRINLTNEIQCSCFYYRFFLNILFKTFEYPILKFITHDLDN